MAIFNSYVKLPEGNDQNDDWNQEKPPRCAIPQAPAAGAACVGPNMTRPHDQTFTRPAHPCHPLFPLRPSDFFKTKIESEKSKPLGKPLAANCLGTFGCNISGCSNVWSGANMSKSATATQETSRNYGKGSEKWHVIKVIKAVRTFMSLAFLCTKKMSAKVYQSVQGS